MRLLMFSLDPKLVDPNSSVSLRHREYAAAIGELTIVLLAKTSCEQKINEDALTIFTPGPRKKLALWWWGRGLAKKVADDYAHKGDAVVSSPDPFFVGLLAWLVARKFALPLQLQLHTDIFASAFRRESWMNRWRILLARFLLPRAQGIRVVSERMKKLLPTAYCLLPERITVLPIFVDTEKFRAATASFSLKDRYPQFEKIILWVGRLTHEKNPALALEIFAKLHAAHPSWGLIICGDGPERKALELKVESEKLKEAVLFLGWTNELLHYYKSADVLLVTSLYEGYGMQIVEALAAGCPVVSTDVGIAREAGAIVCATPKEILKQLENVIQTRQGGVLRSTLVMTKQEYLSKITSSIKAMTQVKPVS